MRLSGHGLSIELPPGWEGRIRVREGGGPVLHLATFPLQAGDGDFGAAATGRMRPGEVFAALVEYRGDGVRPGVGLFAPRRPPPPSLHEFGPQRLQVTRPGQLGWQSFFTEGGRTCCLYAVISLGRGDPARLVSSLRRVLSSLAVAPAAPR